MAGEIAEDIEHEDKHDCDSCDQDNCPKHPGRPHETNPKLN
jgi:hypothetical protein